MSELDAERDDATLVLAGIAARAMPQIGGENFPVALRLVPRRPRAHLARVYGFARFVDDVGDDAPGDRMRLLDIVEYDVRALWSGEPVLAPVAALRPLLDETSVTARPFLDLIEANRVDQRVSRYESFDDLLGYCRLSAAPVGELVLHIAHAATEANLADSGAVCAALQVLEHCQDVGEDARMGRVYLPAADLRAAGVTDAELTAATASPRLRSVVALEVDRSLDLLRAGPHLVHQLRGWARLAVSGYVAGGLATASALRAADHDVLARPVRPGKVATARRAVRLLAGR